MNVIQCLDQKLENKDMVRCCCVKGCRNRSNRVFGLSYFSIPAIIATHADTVKELSTLRRQRWIDAIGRNTDDANWEPKEHHKVCSEHFISGKKSASGLWQYTLSQPKNEFLTGCSLEFWQKF